MARRGLAVGVACALASMACSLVNLEGLSDQYSQTPDGAVAGDSAPRPGDAIAADAPFQVDPPDAEIPDAPPGVTELAKDLGEPLGIALTRLEVYWVSVRDNAIYKVSKAGGAPQRVAAENASDPFDVAVDESYVYWSERASNSVFRQRHGTATRELFFTSAVHAAFLAVDNGVGYVTDDRDDLPAVGSVIRSASGSTVGEILFGNQGIASGITITRGKLFWARGVSGEIVQGGQAGATTSLLSGRGRIRGLAVDDQFVYFIEDKKRIVRAARAAGSVGTIHEGNEFGDGDIAVDDKTIYWTEKTNGVIRRRPK